jgi:hypothetical protein
MLHFLLSLTGSLSLHDLRLYLALTVDILKLIRPLGVALFRDGKLSALFFKLGGAEAWGETQTWRTEEMSGEENAVER